MIVFSYLMVVELELPLNHIIATLCRLPVVCIALHLVEVILKLCVYLLFFCCIYSSSLFCFYCRWFYAWEGSSWSIGCFSLLSLIDSGGLAAVHQMIMKSSNAIDTLWLLIATNWETSFASSGRETGSALRGRTDVDHFISSLLVLMIIRCVVGHQPMLTILMLLSVCRVLYPRQRSSGRPFDVRCEGLLVVWLKKVSPCS